MAARVNEWGVTKEEEQAKLASLSERAHEAGFLGKGLTAYDLLRYLRAREYDIDKAMAMLRATMEWREEYGTDDALSWSLPALEEGMKFYPNGYHGVDRHGRPVYYQEVGHLDVKRLLEVTTEKDIVRLFVKNFELFLLRLAPSCAVQMGRPVTQYTTVMDMKGVGLRHFTAQSRAILHATSVISEAHYPETMAKLFIVNAPAIFSVIWAFVRPLLAPRTQQKIVVLRDNGNATLLRHIAPDQLPVKYGGTSTRDIADFFGPWEDLLGPQSWTTLRDPADPPPPRLDKYLKSLRLTKPLESTGEGLLLMTTEAPEVAPEGWSGWLWGWVGYVASWLPAVTAGSPQDSAGEQHFEARALDVDIEKSSRGGEDRAATSGCCRCLCWKR